MPGGGVPMAVIILGVFKWIGIILLCILGLMLLLCLAVLLIPIRYQLSAVWQEEHRVKGSVSWLLHLIHLSFDTDRNQRVCIRIFGIPVNGRFHTKKKKFQKRRKVKQKRKASGSTKVQRKESVSPAKVQKAVESSTTAGEPKEAGGAKTADSFDTSVSLAAQKSSGENTDTVQRTVPDKAADMKKRADSSENRFVRTLRRITGRVKKFFLSIAGLFAKIKAIDEESIELLQAVLKSSGGLLKHMAPRSLRGRLHFGTGDPALTGQLLGVLSVLFAMWGKGIAVIPDFEQEVFEGEAAVKGYARGIIVLILIIRAHPLRLMERLDRS
ncbi:MAG TPA: hypothetical protein DIV56_00335 [Lachnospiraceae bacterium]|nr:hypothetical protein [Lachnospiraceae bacterium]